MEKSKESKEIFKIHIEGPDADRANKNINTHEIEGFLIFTFSNNGVGVTGRNVDNVHLSGAMAHDDGLRRVALAAVVGGELLKEKKEIEDGKEN